MEIRLDRALISKAFNDLFTDTKLTNLEISTSDHSPIFLEPMTIIHVAVSRFFKFENAWLREPMCRQIVEEVWYRHEGRTLQEKLSECAIILQTWGNEITSSFKSRILQCKKVLKSTKGRRDAQSVMRFQETSSRLNEIYNQ